MAEELFVVRTSREGSASTTPEIENILSEMGIVAFRNRHEGRIGAVVETVGGRVTRQKVVLDDTNDRSFNDAHSQNANLLLTEVVRAVNGGGDGTYKVIMTVKK